MSVEKLQFPLRRLTLDEIKNCRMITGQPQPDRQRTIGFLRGGEYPLKQNTRMMWLMNVTLAHTLQDLGAYNETGMRLFSSGALLVSSLYQFVNHQTDLVVHDKALDSMEQRDQREIVLDGPLMLQQQAGDICNLLDRLMPVLDPGDEPEQLAFIGASALYQVLIESQQLAPQITPIPEQLAAYEEDASLQALSELFKRELG